VTGPGPPGEELFVPHGELNHEAATHGGAAVSLGSGDDVDWSGDAELFVEAALSEVPAVGWLLEVLVGLLWPDQKQDVWSQVAHDVEAYVSQQLDQTVYDDVKATLSGLHNVTHDWLQAVSNHKTGGTPVSYSTWNTAYELYRAATDQFKRSGYEVLLLPLFTQFVNLQLGLMRDGIASGSRWGWDRVDVAQIGKDIAAFIPDHTAYAQKTYVQGYEQVFAANGGGLADYQNCQPFKAVNAYRRRMTLHVLDFVARWPYYDANKYPNGGTAEQLYLDREIYSDPHGQATDTGLIVLPWRPPTRPIAEITVWSSTMVDSVQLVYPSMSGPDGATAKRMGNIAGGTPTVLQVADKPVVAVSGRSADALNALSFTFQDGTTTSQLGGGGGNPWTETFWNSKKNRGQILSSMYVNGLNSAQGVCDCIVLGFKYPR
jgi:delta endotoxin-like protein